MEIEEFYGSTYYNKFDYNGIKISTAKDKSTIFKIFNEITLIFLPQGYPQSVSKDYLEYQLWDSLQAYCSTISGSLAMQAVLRGSGVGDESASVIAATITWIIKDGTGMVGRIWFAWMKSNSLDGNCKSWRLFADILNDISIFIDIIASMWTTQFRIISCFAAFLRALVGVAGGATRSSITQHQALRHNTADVAAKDGSQETLVNLFGLISSIIILPYFTNFLEVLFLLIFLTMIHLYANYKAVTSLQFDTLNRDRFHILASQFFNTNTISSISETNINEHIILPRILKLRINFGCSFSEFSNNVNKNKTMKIENLMTMFEGKNYILFLNSLNNNVYVIFNSYSSPIDYFLAYFHFEYLNFTLDQNLSQVSSNLLQKSINYVDKHFKEFLDLLIAKNWRTDVAWLSQDEWTFKNIRKHA